MAKYKLAGKTKRAGGRPPQAVGCVILIAMIVIGVMLLFYFAMKTG
jgi:hypothetical protein